MVLFVDNYDSFTYNLVQLVKELHYDVLVVRNNAVSPEEIVAVHPEAVVISPGPSDPEHAGICIDLIRVVAGRIPVLGICLGHQCIVHAFGGRITRLSRVVHGRASWVYHDGSRLFRDVPNPFRAARYHSLAADAPHLPACLKVTAQADDAAIMAVEHREYPVFGLQFHPESVLTVHGRTILRNFLSLV